MIKNLPKDLLNAASELLNTSEQSHKKNYRNVVQRGLKEFKVNSFNDLSEEDQKLFTTWVANRLDEQSCGCDEEENLLMKQAKVNAHSGLPELGEEETDELLQKEDDMPNDEVLYKNGEKKKDLGEAEKAEKDFDKDGELESPEAEWKGSRDAAIKAAMKNEEEKKIQESLEIDSSHANKVVHIMKSALRTSDVEVDSYTSSGKHMTDITASINDLDVVVRLEDSKKQSGKLVWVISQELGDAAINDIVTDSFSRDEIDSRGLNLLSQSLKKVNIRNNKIQEEYASAEPSSAIGHRREVEAPKHADVILDTDILKDARTFRLMVQYPNARPEFIPSVELPGAPSLEALGELVSEMNDPDGVISKAIAEAMDLPSQRPEYIGNDKQIQEETLNEVSPPDPKIEKWIIANKERFKKEYGAEKGMQVLYAKAWDMYNKK